eukprot:4033716-Amphidinium_carterae.1
MTKRLIITALPHLCDPLLSVAWNHVLTHVRAHADMNSTGNTTAVTGSKDPKDTTSMLAAVIQRGCSEN